MVDVNQTEKDMIKNAVGNRINELCEHRGLTINALAVKSKVPPSTLKNIVYGQVENTGIETLAKLCGGLGVTLEEFFSSELFK